MDNNKEFNALVVRRNEDNKFTYKVEKKLLSSLKKDILLIKVYYISIHMYS